MQEELKIHLNRAAAQLCGWKWFHNPKSGISIDREGQLLGPLQIERAWKGWVPCDPAGIETHQTYCPDYCHDRNATYEILQAVASLWKQCEFESEFLKIGLPKYSVGMGLFDSLCVDPSAIVMAALLACEAWTEEIEALWQKEPR